MKRMQAHYLMGIAGLFLCRTVVANVTNCEIRSLKVTVDNALMHLYIDGVEITGLPNADNWLVSKTVVLLCTARVIGIEGTDLGLAAGVLASTDDGFIITNSSWKCTKQYFTDWQTTDFDDSDWPAAFETLPHIDLPHQLVPGIRTDAFWIWTTAYVNGDLLVYCRKTIGRPLTPPIAKDFVWKASPSFGPISGGTKVNITIVGWSQTNLNVTVVYFGNTLKASIVHSERSNDSLVVLTPSTTEFLIGDPLMISVKFSPGLFIINTNKTFTYGRNPNITDITPKRFLVTGGMSLTVTGNDLNSVANPFIQATVSVHREIESNSTSTTTYEPCDSSAGDGGHLMLCVMPPVNLPKDFLDGIGNGSYVDQAIVGPNGKDRVDINIGFVLDGYKKYENTTDAIPGLELEIYVPPEITASKELIRFNPKSDEIILIKGRHMTRGCQLEDYEVHLGSGICSKTLLTDNALTCRPPKSEPQKTDKDVQWCERNLAVIVTIGYKTYYCACLTYSSLNEVALGIGLGVGLSLLFLAILIVIITVTVVKYRRNIAKK